MEGKFDDVHPREKPSPENIAEFEAEFRKRMDSIMACPQCGEKKQTEYIQGRPYMPFMHWAYAKNEELGWKAFVFGGCTAPGENYCAVCYP